MLASASLALGHATFQQLWVDGVDQASSCVRRPPSNSPINGVTSNDMRCNVGGATGVAGVCDVPGRFPPVPFLIPGPSRLTKYR